MWFRVGLELSSGKEVDEWRAPALANDPNRNKRILSTSVV